MPQIDAQPILQLLGSHMAAKYLFTANQIGLFTTLADGPLDLDGLAAAASLPRRTLRIVADALVATGFLERCDGTYHNSAVAAAFLSGGAGPDLRPILQMWDQVVYRQWDTLETAVRCGQATYGYDDFTPQEQQVFAVGVAALTAPSAQALAATYDWSSHRELLDLGGGTGSFTLAILRQAPALDATVYELPATAAVIRRRHAQLQATTAFQIVEGNFLADPLPKGCDVVLLANVIHLYSPQVNQGLLRRVREAVTAGARLLLVDFWTDATHTQPAFAALMAGEFLIVGGEGDVYSVDEAATWLRGSGWQLVEHKPLAGAASLIVAEAVDR